MQVLASAAWIVGEYSSVLTSVYHDCSNDGENEFYLDGPFDEEIPSKWRGKFLHNLVIRALLHPLVGACLPTMVQVAYMSAAMKIFVEGALCVFSIFFKYCNGLVLCCINNTGVSSCDNDEVASLVALLRVRFSESSDHSTFGQVWCLCTTDFIFLDGNYSSLRALTLKSKRKGRFFFNFSTICK